MFVTHSNTIRAGFDAVSIADSVIVPKSVIQNLQLSGGFDMLVELS